MKTIIPLALGVAALMWFTSRDLAVTHSEPLKEQQTLFQPRRK